MHEASRRPGLSDRNISLALDASGSSALLSAGFDPAFGARPLRRLVEKTVLTAVSKLLISGAVEDDSIVTVAGGSDGMLEFRVAAGADQNATDAAPSHTEPLRQKSKRPSRDDRSM